MELNGVSLNGMQFADRIAPCLLRSRPLYINPSFARPLRSRRVQCVSQRDEDAPEVAATASNSTPPLQIAAALGAFLFCGVGNRVSYKMTLVPMREYIFFLAQFLSLVYVVVYFPVLYIRYRMGKVTKEMLGIPKQGFVVIGMCEAVAMLLLLICTARLPGIILPILQQLLVIWQLLTSKILLNKKYSGGQIAGVLFVVAGSILAATATSASTASGEASIPFMLLMNVVFILYSLAGVTKEKIFVDSQKRLGGRLDLFVVNSFGSLAQALGTLLLFPLLVKARNMTFQELPRYFTEGISCFCGTSLSATSDCTGAPMLPLIYIAMNLVLNISALYLVGTVGVVVTSLASSLIVPATVAVFTLNLPFLGAGSRLSLQFLAGCAILTVGMLIYSAKDFLEMQKRNRATQES